MKILISTDKYYPYVSGVITSVMNLEKELTKRGHEVKILTLSETPYTHVDKNVIYIGSFSAKLIYPDIRLKHPVLRKVINSLIEWKPDIIHSNCEFSTFILAKQIARTCKIPMVHTYHTDYEDYVHYVALSKELGVHIVKRYINYICGHMQRIICPTQKTADILTKYGIQQPLDIIPTGLDLERFNAPITETKRDELLTRYRLNKETPILLFIGRIGKEKNIEEVLRLLSKSKRKNFQFLIVGDGPDKMDLQKKVVEYGLNGKVTFTGMIPQQEVASFYKLGRLFISASQSETQGLTYIEALASGLPLLAKKDECLKDVVVNGENGYQFTTEAEFEEYFNKLLDLSDEEYKMMSDVAQKRTQEAFSLFSFCDKVLESYQKALSKPVRSHFFKELYYRFAKVLPFV